MTCRCNLKANKVSKTEGTTDSWTGTSFSTVACDDTVC